MSRSVEVKVSESTANWLQWSRLKDHERSLARAKAARRLIELWADIKGFQRWSRITEVPGYSKSPSEGRWIRRNLLTLAQAGLIELDTSTKYRDGYWFRVKRTYASTH